jgi:hypothetical protein
MRGRDKGVDLETIKVVVGLKVFKSLKLVEERQIDATNWHRKMENEFLKLVTF